MTVQQQYFQFTLGPVQGFVAQARRTRDFWAGSFILSWLASVAMEAIKAQGGVVKFPVPDEAYLSVLRGEDAADAQFPQQGCIPNRFSATTAAVPADFKPELVTIAVQQAWSALADVVWAEDLEQVASSHRGRWPQVQLIWQRQVTQFWEMSWVMSDEDQPNLLDRRKNWRSVVSPHEPGHKCMMMDGWQELSGETQTSVAAVQAFWQKVRTSGASGIKTDLREGEQLCAMAFIKRRFARYFEQVEITLAGSSQKLFGWPVPYAVPSVAFIAAAPWIARLVEQGSIDAWRQFHASASRITESSELAHVGEARQRLNRVSDIEIRGVAEAARLRQQSDAQFDPAWAGLDGQVYHRTQLQNVRIFEAPAAQINEVTQALRNLRASAGVGEEPSPYYAIVLMDGDQLGKHMGKAETRPRISAALNVFTRGVAELVRAHDGFLVYAGGDDVLALFPMAQALPAAAKLQAFYKDCFAQHCAEVKSTLSGAIEYAHIRTPLTQVLGDAHGLLDDVAKEETGRDAIACRVWKPSGLALTWAMPWKHALSKSDAEKAPQTLELCALAAIYGNQGAGEDEQAFSASFFHRMKEVLERFSGAPQEVLIQLLRAEHSHSWGGGSRNEARRKLQEDHLTRLVEQCKRWQLAPGGGAYVVHHASSLNPDAALLVRFLAQQGQEREWQ